MVLLGVTEKDIEKLAELDMGDFAGEVERLIGKDTYQSFVRAGKGMRDIYQEILQMINKNNVPRPNEQVLFKDTAAQCYD